MVAARLTASAAAMLPSPGSDWSHNGAAACSKDDDTGERGGRCGNSAECAAARARCTDTAVIRWTPPRRPGDHAGMPGVFIWAGVGAEKVAYRWTERLGVNTSADLNLLTSFDFYL